jgi:MFS family permease
VAGIAPLALAAESWQLAVLAFVAGAGVAAPTVCASLVLVDVTTHETRTEGTAWMGALGAAGAAIGIATAGAVVDAADARAALLAVFGASAVGFVVVLLRQRTFAAPAGPVAAEVV